ncbi:MAG: thymidine kinase [Pseudomonadota bacterium]
MAKLYFNYSAMNAGKSAILLQAAYNYRERGMNVLLLRPTIDYRGPVGEITSRIGLSAPADMVPPDKDLKAHIAGQHKDAPLACVLVDEAQFLTEDQAWQLASVADEMSIPVLCYGIRTDFSGALFPGSAALLAMADSLREIRTICWCGRKATMTARIGEDGKVVSEGDQVKIGGNESYVSLCRRHWASSDLGNEA